MANHPVWLEAKLRALIGLEKLEDAYGCWTLLSQESVKRLFIEPMLSLAELQKNGPLSLKLLDLLSDLISGNEDASELSPVIMDDAPPPLPESDPFFDEGVQDLVDDEIKKRLPGWES